MTVDLNSSSFLEAVSLDPLSSDLPLDKWQALSQEALDPNPFFGHSFLRAFQQYMPRQNTRLIVVREKNTGTWLMAAPVGRRRLGLVVPGKTIWTTDYSPLGTPLLHPSSGQDVPELFVHAAAGSSKLIGFPYLPFESQTARRIKTLTGWTALVGFQSKRASHEAGAVGEAQLAEAFAGKRHKEMRRQLRRLEDRGVIVIKHLTGQDTREGFEAFLKLETRGWKGRNGTALLSDPKTSDFAKAAIEARSTLNGVRIDQLWVDDTLIASLVLFSENGHAFSWKIAFDESYARYSPGAQIVLMAMQENLKQPGFVRADSLAFPGHSMIEPLWKGRLELGTLLLAKGGVGAWQQRLCAADLRFERIARAKAKALKKHLRP